MKRTLVAALAFTAVASLAARQTPSSTLKIEQVMTSLEMDATGVSDLTKSQRAALDIWLNIYTKRVLDSATKLTLQKQIVAIAESRCDPAIESTISGDIEGWSGETIFKLDNGQIWEQAEYSYNYFYAYRPQITIYHTGSGCRMKVEDEEETILVRRIK